MAQRPAGLQREKKKYETGKFLNVNLFRAGDMQKDIYLGRRAELSKIAERIEVECKKRRKNA
jgi:hypothetical protein